MIIFNFFSIKIGTLSEILTDIITKNPEHPENPEKNKI